MERARLGNSDLDISLVGLGTSAIGGGDWVLGWGPQDRAQSMATIRRALERGINWIDTAAAYGLGHAERIVGRALRGVPGRERPYVFTRCGLVWDELGNVSHDLGPHSIRCQAEASLRRLGTDCVDLYQIGWPAWPATSSLALPGALERAWETMAVLQREGKARFIGVATCRADQLARLDRMATVTSLTVPYSLLRQPALDPAAADGIATGVLACSTLESGLLTGTMTPERVCSLPQNDWRRRHPFFQELARIHASRAVERLRAVAADHGSSPAAIAVAWALGRPGVTAAIVGARRPDQIDEVVPAASSRLREAAGVELVPGLSSPGRSSLRTVAP